jgi:ABC-type multidrug transport system fused ATPase/permease subunit
VLIVGTVLGGILLPVMQISKAISASSGFFDIIDAERASFEGLRDPEVSAHADIEFRDVTFAYPMRPNIKVLKGFNARFEKGKTTALVGPSGSGKSTIVALLELWYSLDGSPKVEEPVPEEKPSANEADVTVDIENPEGAAVRNSGCIFVDGPNLKDVHMKWWRSQIGLVQQEPFLFNDSIFNNVALD